MDKIDYLPTRHEWKKAGLDIRKCTCVNCYKKEKCPQAFDVYNYDGDCIMEK